MSAQFVRSWVIACSSCSCTHAFTRTRPEHLSACSVHGHLNFTGLVPRAARSAAGPCLIIIFSRVEHMREDLDPTKTMTKEGFVFA